MCCQHGWVLWHGTGVLALCSPIHKTPIALTALTTCNIHTHTYTPSIKNGCRARLNAPLPKSLSNVCIKFFFPPSQRGRAHEEFSWLCENHCAKNPSQTSNTVLHGHMHTLTHSAHSGLHTLTVIFQDLSQSQQRNFLEQQSFSYSKQAVPPLRLNLSEQPYHVKRKEKKNLSKKNQKRKPHKDNMPTWRHLSKYCWKTI